MCRELLEVAESSSPLREQTSEAHVPVSASEAAPMDVDGGEKPAVQYSVVCPPSVAVRCDLTVWGMRYREISGTQRWCNDAWLQHRRGYGCVGFLIVSTRPRADTGYYTNV